MTDKAALDKAALDANTDQLIAELRAMRDQRPGDSLYVHARLLAEAVAGQVPGSDAGRALIVLVQLLAEPRAVCPHAMKLLALIGAAGLELTPREEVPGA